MPRLPQRYETAFRLNRARGSGIPLPVPFAPEPYWAVHPDGGIVVGDGHAFRLNRIDATGDTTMIIEVSRAPIPVTRRERDSAMANTGEGSWVGRPDIPSHKPAHGPMFVDDQGRIWVQRSKHAMTWDVLSGEGELLGQVDVPLAFAGSPSVRGERMALSTLGSGPVHMAVVYDLVCRG